MGPVEGPTLLGGGSVYRVEVPQGATRLEIQLRTSTAGADLDLFVRRGSAPALSGGRVTAAPAPTPAQPKVVKPPTPVKQKQPKPVVR